MATATGSDLLPTRSHELLQRADAELVAAQFSSEAWERFSHAHLAALRGGAALLAVRGRPGGRRPPRTVWDMLRVVAPELARWSDYFAGGAGLRSAIEAGRFDAVCMLLSADVSPVPPVHGAASRRLGVRAS